MRGFLRSPGKNVFQNVKRAASILVRDINKDTTLQPIKDDFQQVVDLLLLSTKEIAELSLETAQEVVGILEINARSLGTAVSEFTKGKLEADAAKAINAFGKSWQSSQKAVSKRLRELAILNFDDSPDPFTLEIAEVLKGDRLKIFNLLLIIMEATSRFCRTHTYNKFNNFIFIVRRNTCVQQEFQ